MYDANGNIYDQREMLKIKIKHLAAESKIIRFQEKRSRGSLRNSMRLHRIDVVRYEARLALIAYAIVRGKPIGEKKDSAPFNSARVESMVRKYGSNELRQFNFAEYDFTTSIAEHVPLIKLAA